MFGTSLLIVSVVQHENLAHRVSRRQQAEARPGQPVVHHHKITVASQRSPALPRAAPMPLSRGAKAAAARLKSIASPEKRVLAQLVPRGSLGNTGAGTARKTGRGPRHTPTCGSPPHTAAAIGIPPSAAVPASPAPVPARSPVSSIRPRPGSDAVPGTMTRTSAPKTAFNCAGIVFETSPRPPAFAGSRSIVTHNPRHPASLCFPVRTDLAEPIVASDASANFFRRPGEDEAEAEVFDSARADIPGGS